MEGTKGDESMNTEKSGTPERRERGENQGRPERGGNDLVWKRGLKTSSPNKTNF